MHACEANKCKSNTSCDFRYKLVQCLLDKIASHHAARVASTYFDQSSHCMLQLEKLQH